MDTAHQTGNFFDGPLESLVRYLLQTPQSRVRGQGTLTRESSMAPLTRALCGPQTLIYFNTHFQK